MKMGLKEITYINYLENKEKEIEIDISEFKDIQKLFFEDDEKYDNLFSSDEIEIYKEIDQTEDIEEYEENKKNKYKLVTRRIDSNRIRHKTAKNLEVYTSILKNVKMDIDNGPIRSGAIIYTHHEGKTYFCLGVDSAYGDLTDFAGGVKKDESIIEGGLRELKEESQNIFGKIEIKEVEKCMSFYTNNMLIMFIRRDVDMEETKKKFYEKLKMAEINKEIEVSGVVWLESSEFINSILGKGRRLYSRVRRILSKTISIIEAL